MDCFRVADSQAPFHAFAPNPPINQSTNSPIHQSTNSTKRQNPMAPNFSLSRNFPKSRAPRLSPQRPLVFSTADPASHQTTSRDPSTARITLPKSPKTTKSSTRKTKKTQTSKSPHRRNTGKNHPIAAPTPSLSHHPQVFGLPRQVPHSAPGSTSAGA